MWSVVLPEPNSWTTPRTFLRQIWTPRADAENTGDIVSCILYINTPFLLYLGMSGVVALELCTVFLCGTVSESRS